jgi:hypothetical protein
VSANFTTSAQCITRPEANQQSGAVYSRGVWGMLGQKNSILRAYSFVEFQCLSYCRKSVIVDKGKSKPNTTENGVDEADEESIVSTAIWACVSSAVDAKIGKQVKAVGSQNDGDEGPRMTPLTRNKILIPSGHSTR